MRFLIATLLFALAPGTGASAQEGKNAAPIWPMFGGTPSRNMVNRVDKKMPAEWSGVTGKNIKWVADLGSRSYGSPVIANGKILVGTNNAAPRDPNNAGNRAVLMAFRESDGKFLWQHAEPYPANNVFQDAVARRWWSTALFSLLQRMEQTAMATS